MLHIRIERKAMKREERAVLCTAYCKQTLITAKQCMLGLI